MTRSSLGAIAVAAGAAAIALALVSCGASPEAAPAPSGSVSPSAPAPAPTAVVDAPVAPATSAPARVPVPPVAVTVAAVDVAVPVQPVGIDANGAMELPVDPAIAGWYRFGADPTRGAGHTVISAHVDAPDYPIGPFSRLRDLAAGEAVQLQDAAGGIFDYVVQSVTYYRKTDLPVAELFAREGPPAVVLITCGGAFDAAVGRYEDNVVVIATPLG